LWHLTAVLEFASDFLLREARGFEIARGLFVSRAVAPGVNR